MGAGIERRAAIRTLTLAIVAAAVSLPGDTVATLNIASQNALHLSDSERYRRLNDVVCVCVGEVRTPSDPDQESPDLVIDVAGYLLGARDAPL